MGKIKYMTECFILLMIFLLTGIIELLHSKRGVFIMQTTYLCQHLNMKTKSLHKDKVNIITLGCSKNMVDSEVLSGQLVANEIDVVHESGKKEDRKSVV